MAEVDPSRFGVRPVMRDVPDWHRDGQSLYRGDARTPDEIRADGGFRPPYMSRPDWRAHPERAVPDLAQHVGGNTNAFVSTSTDRGVAEDFAVAGHVYVINAPGGIFTDPTLHPTTGRDTHGEGEVLFPGGVDWRYVHSWHPMTYEPGAGFVLGDAVPNPDYIGDRPTGTATAHGPAGTATDQPAPARPDGQQPDQRGQDSAPPGWRTGRPDAYGPSTPDATRTADRSRQDRGASPLAERHGGARPAGLGDRMGPLSDPRLDALRPHLRSTESGMSAFAPTDSAGGRHQNELDTANQVPRIPGQFVVDLHGSADAVRIGDTPLSPRDLADLIRANPDYDGGPVSLLGCGTGSGPDGFAARLARELGVPVTAPTRDAWVDHNGNVFAASQASNTDSGRPAWPPNGAWHTFAPNGDRTVHSGPYPPGHTPTWAGAPTRAPGAVHRGDDTDDTDRSRTASGPPTPDDRAQDRPGPRPSESVDAAREAAARTRTDTGEVDTDAVADLLDGLPSLPDDSPDSIRALVEGMYDGDVTVEPVGGHEGRARTERPVYRVMVNGEPVGYVKVVPDGPEFAAELSAADRLHQAGLSDVRVPDVLAVASVPGPDSTPRGVLFSALAPGDSVDDMLRRVHLAWDRDRAMDDLRQAVAAVAEGMAELHRGSDRPASPSYLNPHADAIRGHLADLDARRELLARHGIDLDEISAAMDATIADALADPGPAGLAHGDAHLGNFLWDADAGVTLIDAPTMHQSMNAAGDPIGSPARDVTLFNQRIGHFGFEFGLSQTEIAQLRGHFADAYTRGGGPAVPPPVRAMFDARAATHRLVRAVDRLENRPDPRRAADVGAAAAALQDALNLDNTAATELANGFAGELPGTPEFRRAWTAMDNFRSYMTHTADPAVRARFEAEYADRVNDLQARQTKAFKALWEDLFPRKRDEYGLSPEGRARAEERIRGFVADAENLMAELAEFAASTGDPALADGHAPSTMDREGTAAWEASFRETQARINEVIRDFTYRGHELGYIGSMKSGWRGPHKGKTRFDPNDFDVDLYVVVDQETFDQIRATYPYLDSDGTKLMPSDEEPEDLVELSERIGQALKAEFPHVRGIEESVIAIRAEQPW